MWERENDECIHFQRYKQYSHIIYSIAKRHLCGYTQVDPLQYFLSTLAKQLRDKTQT